MTISSKNIFGAEIQYFRLDPRYWETVLDRFVDTGLKCVTTYVQWSTHLVGEPDATHPAGVLDFTGRTNPSLNVLHFLDLVQQRNLRLNFRCGPFCCNEMEFGGLPRSLVLGDPGMMVWNHQNRTTQGYWIARSEGSQPSYLHPEYLDWCRRWLNEVGGIIRPRLTSNGGFIDMVNLDNEVSYNVKDSFLESDYNPVNLRIGGFYHQFLREKYGNVARIPWAGKGLAIEDLHPPREVPHDISGKAGWYLDWVEFKEWCMCRYLGELRAMHVANGVSDVLFMTNFNPHLPEGVPTRMPTFEKSVKGKGRGIVGYDFYRGTFLSWSGYSSMARVLRLMNASVDYTWSAEFMSGTWEKILTSRVSDEHMRFMARCALANGCKSLAWFMFHDRRVWGDCPVSPHGHVRPSHAVLTETYRLCTEQIPHWDALQVQADVAVVYDVVHHRHTSIGDPSPCDDGKLHVGTPLIAGNKAGIASREYMGLHRVIEAAGFQPGAVDIVARPAELDRYRLICYPGSPIATRSGSLALRAWVEAGGTLVISGIWPSLDELGNPLAFMDLSDPLKTKQKLGKGQLIHVDYLGQEESDSESLAHMAILTELILEQGEWHVRLQQESPVSWETWGDGGGVDNAGTKTGSSTLDRIRHVEQPRLHASAILQQDPSGNGFPVLFVLNCYPEPAEFRITLNTLRPKRLRNLVTGHVIDVKDGSGLIDLDRKAGEAFAVE